MHAQTRRQREVLDFIIRYIDSHGYRPSYQLIARHMGVRSRAGIGRIVRDLETQGLITRRREQGHFYLDVGKNHPNDGTTSGVEVHWLTVPDEREFAEPWESEPFHVPEFMLAGHDTTLYRAFIVPDDSMAADGIHEDDIALIELKEGIRDGDRVVAILNKRRAVLRKYFRAGAHVELCAAGDGEVIKLAADRVELKGVYRGLLRLA